MFQGKMDRRSLKEAQYPHKLETTLRTSMTDQPWWSHKITRDRRDPKSVGAKLYKQYTEFTVSSSELTSPEEKWLCTLDPVPKPCKGNGAYGSKWGAEASLERDRAQKGEALGEKTVLGRARRKADKLRITQHTQLATSAPWPRVLATLQTFAGSLHRPGLPDKNQARIALAVAWSSLPPPVGQLGLCPREWTWGGLVIWGRDSWPKFKEKSHSKNLSPFPRYS